LKSAKLRIASKLILRSRKICPRLVSLEFSNNFLCHSQMFPDMYYRIHSQKFRTAMETEAKKSLCYSCARRWKILFLEEKDYFLVLHVRQTCVRVFRIRTVSITKYVTQCSVFSSLTKLGQFSTLLRFNPLNTKRNLLYIRNQSVPRSKHFPARL
jgi:hypothetical protein